MERKHALEIARRIETEISVLTSEDVNAKLVSLGAWEEAVEQSSPDDRRSLLVVILTINRLLEEGGGRINETEQNSDSRIRPLIVYPVCIGETTARMGLPRDLTIKEAARIYGVMKTLCVDSPEDIEPSSKP